MLSKIRDVAEIVAVVGGFLMIGYKAVANADKVPYLEQRVSSMERKMDFVVRYVEEKSGRKYKANDD